MKCKFCDNDAKARGLCAVHYNYARTGLAGLTQADFNPRIISPETTRLETMTDVTAIGMVRMFAEEFEKLRVETNISKHALATKSGLTRKTIYRIEENHQNMRVSTFLATLGTVPFGPALLHRLADKLQAMQDAKT